MANSQAILHPLHRGTCLTEHSHVIKAMTVSLITQLILSTTKPSHSSRATDSIMNASQRATTLCNDSIYYADFIASYPGHPIFFNIARENIEKHGVAWI